MPAKTPVPDRLRRNSVIDPETGCHVWTAQRNRAGYGIFYPQRTQRRLAHRVAYETFVGPIPEGLVLDHLCRNRACINPKHLEPVTVSENNLRGEGFMAVHARKTHCPSGHPYDEDNTISRNGARRCRACISEYNRAYRERTKTPAA